MSAAVRRRGKLRRWRKVLKANAFSHRWVSLVIGILLIFEVASGVVLLFRPELYQLGHPEFFAATSSAHPLSQQQALQVIAEQRPGIDPRVVTTTKGVYQVESADYTRQTYVDPGSGRILGDGSYSHGILAWLMNMHDCAFSCTGYSGYLPFMATTFLGLQVSAFVLGILGLAFVWLCISGIIAWWPGIRRLAKGFLVHRKRGTYRYNRDLHDVLGILAIPALFMWALTGAGYELPFIGTAWYAVTGSGGPPSADFASHASKAADITPDQARAAGAKVFPGANLVSVTLPESAEPTSYYYLTYDLGVPAAGHGGIRRFGDTTVAVDRHDAGRTAVIAGGNTDIGERVWTKWNYGIHFGYAVGWGWRLLWLAFGIVPLVLAYTGIRTWWTRYRRRRRPPDLAVRTKKPDAVREEEKVSIAAGPGE